MNIAILGGFLGSGKTSLLIQLLHHLAGDADEGETRVAVIENEIGAIGIDNQLIEGEGFQVQNLFAGCVCCTMTGDLVRSIETISKELAPQWLVVESTGVAYPGRMKEVILKTFGIESRIAIVVDAKRWRRLLGPLENLIIGQLEDADAVLINKTDLVLPEELEGISQSIDTFNKQAHQHAVCATRTIERAVWESVLGYSC